MAVWACFPQRSTFRLAYKSDFADRKDQLIPQVEILKRFRCLIQATATSEICGITQLIDPYSTNYWDVLVRRTQMLLLIVERMKPCNSGNTSTLAKEAKQLWFLSAMKETIEAMNEGKLKELDLQDHNGLKVLFGRASAGLQHFLGSNYFLSSWVPQEWPILSCYTRIKRIMQAEMLPWQCHFMRHGL